MSFSNFRMPLRAFISILIGVAVYIHLNNPYHYWVLLTVVLLLPTTTGATLVKSVRRVAGTLMGVLIGLLLVVILPKNLVIYVLVMTVSMFMLTYLFQYYYTTAMIFAGILIVSALTYFVAHANPDKAWEFVVARFFDTLIGAVIVILCAYFIWPDKTQVQIRKQVYELEKRSYDLTQKILCLLVGKPCEPLPSDAFTKLVIQIGTLKTLYNDSKSEPQDQVSKFYFLASIIRNFYLVNNALIAIYNNIEATKELIKDSAQILETINQFNAAMETLKDENHKNIERLSDTFYSIAQAMRQLENSFEDVFTQEKYIPLISTLVNLRTMAINYKYIFVAIDKDLQYDS